MTFNRMGGKTMWDKCRNSVRSWNGEEQRSEGRARERKGYVRGVLSLATWSIAVSAAVTMGADSASAGNSNRGRKILEERQCLSCHSFAGEGAGTASDIGRRSVKSEHSPTEVAALMWSHGPSMWDQMRSQSIQVSPMSKAAADDLFAYFWSVRYFDPRGEAIRGKRLFASKKCDTCHSLTSEAAHGEAPLVSDWAGLSDPELWAQKLWNHSTAMESAMVERGMRWPDFSEQEMVDLLLYLQNLPSTRGDRRHLDFSSPQAGRAMFRTEACADCHSATFKTSRVRPPSIEMAAVVGKPSGKAMRKRSRSDFNAITGFTAAMWNHVPKNLDQGSEAGTRKETFTNDEMGDLISYVYFTGGFEKQGKPARGRRLFLKKGCQSCHGDVAADDRLIEKDGRFSAARMVAAVWSHGPEMLEEMKTSGLEWPKLSGRQMADVIAFLNQER